MTEAAFSSHRSQRHHDGASESSPVGPGKGSDAWSEVAKAAYIKTFMENPTPNMTDTNPQRHVTDLHGKACKAEIKDGQAPELISGKKAKGCDFKDLNGVKDGKLDMPSIYDQSQKSTFHLEVHGTVPGGVVAAVGSGVTVGKDGDKCYVATDDHVVGGANNLKVDHMWAQQNNESFPAKKIWNDPKHDVALLQVDMAKHPELCQPAKIADDPKMGTSVVGAGYPESSNALTLAPGKYLGKGPADQVIGPTDPKDKMKTDPKRTVYASSIHSAEGMSGGGMWNNDKEVTALVGGGFPGITDFSSANPLNRKQIEDAIAKAKNTSR